jgi:hypothetical protein
MLRHAARATEIRVCINLRRRVSIWRAADANARLAFAKTYAARDDIVACRNASRRRTRRRQGNDL